MSSAVLTAKKLVACERARTGSKMLAYQVIALEAGRSVDWLRRLLRDGSSRVTDEIKSRLDALLVRQLEAEIARLQHELDMARQSGSHPASQHYSAIETHLAAARALMNGETLGRSED